MTIRHAANLGIDPPFPSAPRITAKHEIRFYRDDELIALRLFAATYSAHAFIKEYMGDDQFNILTTRLATLGSCVVASDTLDTILSYKPTKAEQQWQLPHEELRNAKQYRGIDLPTPNIAIPPRQKNKKRTEQRKKTRRDPNMLTSANLAEDHNITTREVRTLLRKHFDKPAEGWAWDKKEYQKISKKLAGFL